MLNINAAVGLHIFFYFVVGYTHLSWELQPIKDLVSQSSGDFCFYLRTA